MINRLVLVGRLTKDPELRYTANGIAVTSFTLAVNRPFKNAEGKNEADFINCVVWRKQAENVANYLKKGHMAGVDGRIQTRSYDNDEGRRIFITEVVGDSVQFLETKSSSQGGQGGQSQQTNQGNASQGNQQQNNGQNDDPFAPDGKPVDINDDDLPF